MRRLITSLMPNRYRRPNEVSGPLEEHMTTRKWIAVVVAMLLTVVGNFAFAQGRGHGRKHARNEKRANTRGNNADVRFVFSSQDREVLSGWYRDHENNLPPGLAKRDRLPPGLARQLRERGTLPPGLQKKIEPLPVELERRLPPPPSGCSRVIIGGNIVLMDTKTFYVRAIFRF